MPSIKDTAQAYEPKRMKNIADLEVVSIEQEIKSEVRKEGTDDAYEVSFMVLPDAETGKLEEYRVPNTVLEQLKAILKVKPDMKTFTVGKEGSNLNTKYTVVQLE